MNEAQLVAETIKTIKRDGWIKGYLANDDGKHCILGAVGRARWGEQWDLDCQQYVESEEVYGRLADDPLTKSLINRIFDVVISNSDRYKTLYEEYWLDGREDYVGETKNATVFNWNDDHERNEEEILEVLEKVQAEVGQELESD